MRQPTCNEVAVGDVWQFDANPRGGLATFTIDSIDARFADVTFKTGRKGKVELKTLKRGLRHAKLITKKETAQ